MSEYVVICNDDTPIVFTQKEIKIIRSLYNKFSSDKVLNMDYTSYCIGKIKQFLEYYESLSKQRKMRLNKVEVLSGQSKDDKDIYDWIYNWIDSEKLISELTNFITEYDTDLFTDIIAMKYVEDMYMDPRDFALKYSEIQDMSEDEQDIINDEVDWLSEII